MVTERQEVPVPDRIGARLSSEDEERDPRVRRRYAVDYVIDSVIGRGGMGVVYKATSGDGGRDVAIKVLDARLLGGELGPDFEQRFRMEAATTSKLTHPNTVKVFSYGQAEDDSLYIVMEYLEGENLSQLLRRYGPLPPVRAINIAMQVCASLKEAHDLGIVHRDLKPGNIFLTARGNQTDFVKVYDFGLAKVLGDPESEQLGTETRADLFMGSPSFMSPEQIRKKALDHRSDIYSLGVILYRSLTGVLPFEQDAMVDTLFAHLNKAPPPFEEVCPNMDLPASLERVTMTCLQKDPERRYQNVGDLSMALELCSEELIARKPDDDDITDDSPTHTERINIDFISGEMHVSAVQSGELVSTTAKAAEEPQVTRARARAAGTAAESPVEISGSHPVEPENLPAPAPPAVNADAPPEESQWTLARNGQLPPEEARGAVVAGTPSIPEAPEPVADEEPRRGGRVGILVAVVAVVLLLIGGGGVAALLGLGLLGGGEDADPVPGPGRAGTGPAPAAMEAGAMPERTDAPALVPPPTAGTGEPGEAAAAGTDEPPPAEVADVEAPAPAVAMAPRRSPKPGAPAAAATPIEPSGDPAEAESESESESEIEPERSGDPAEPGSEAELGSEAERTGDRPEPADGSDQPEPADGSDQPEPTPEEFAPDTSDLKDPWAD